MGKFKKFLVENDEEYWAKRMAQFQAAAGGQKDSISDDRSKVDKYTAQPSSSQPTQQKPIEWVQMRDGYYEKMTPEDERNGLTTLSRWNTPAKDGSYYARRTDGRYIINRPNQRLNRLVR